MPITNPTCTIRSANPLHSAARNRPKANPRVKNPSPGQKSAGGAKKRDTAKIGVGRSGASPPKCNAMRQRHRLEIIRSECTASAPRAGLCPGAGTAVGNSVISGHPAYNGYHSGIKHNASINSNNNRAPRGGGGCSAAARPPGLGAKGSGEMRLEERRRRGAATPRICRSKQPVAPAEARNVHYARRRREGLFPRAFFRRPLKGKLREDGTAAVCARWWAREIGWCAFFFRWGTEGCGFGYY